MPYFIGHGTSFFKMSTFCHFSFLAHIECGFQQKVDGQFFTFFHSSFGCKRRISVVDNNYPSASFSSSGTTLHANPPHHAPRW
jgi:hypothetical protein